MGNYNSKTHPGGVVQVWSSPPPYPAHSCPCGATHGAKPCPVLPGDPHRGGAQPAPHPLTVLALARMHSFPVGLPSTQWLDTISCQARSGRVSHILATSVLKRLLHYLHMLDFGHCL